MYIYIQVWTKTPKRLQEIRIVARVIVLDLNNNALLISSIYLLGDKLIASELLIINLSKPYVLSDPDNFNNANPIVTLVYSGYKTLIRYKNKQPF